MFGEEKNDKNTNSWAGFDDSDIFADFSWDKKLKEEVQDFKAIQKRDVFDFLSMLSWILKFFNVILFIVVFFSIGYIYIQKDPAFSESSLIDPVCFIFLWDNNIKEWDLCSSVSYTSNSYKNKINDLKNSQFKKIFSIIWDVYKSESFINSREIVFLKNNLNERLKPTKVLNDFTKLVWDFNKNKINIVCDNLSIDSDNILKASCESYSNWWKKDINWFNSDDKKYYGSSISLANSFLNYVSKSSTNFSLVDRQKSFSIEEGSWSFNESTTKFDLKLKYTNNNISL